MTSVDLGSKITKIENSLFYSCTELKSVKIPNTVTSLGIGSFKNCSNLNNGDVIVESNIKTINSKVFATSALKSITIKNPDCIIDDSDITLGGYLNGTGKPVVYCYKGSTAEEYAKKYGYTFKEISSTTSTTTNPVTNTAKTTTITVKTTVKTTAKTTAKTIAKTTAKPTTTIKPAITSAKKPAFGDPNGDGEINAVDASEILTLYTKTSPQKATLTAAQKFYYDVNKDGRADAVDASYVLSYYTFTQTGGAVLFADYMKNH